MPEDHRRRYGAVEALKIGRGGITYVAKVLGMSRRTIYTGIRELEAMGDDGGSPPRRPSGSAKRIRRPGGGRPKATQRQAGLEPAFDDVLEAHSAGSPTDPSVFWTDLKPMQLAGRAAAAWLRDRPQHRSEAFETGRLSPPVPAQGIITGHVDPQERDQQFRHIDALRRQAQAGGNPVLCVDTKKKELLGHLHRPGQCYSTEVQCVYDHDFRHLANALLVPHGVYDYFDNAGFMTLGTSRETSAFVCDAIALAWEEDRQARYPDAREIVLTFDSGGANAARSLRFKEDLVALECAFGAALADRPLPTLYLQWHPIEHRLFSHVERALRGVILDSHETALQAVQRARTETGLHVRARILDKVYDIGRKCSDDFRDIKDNFIRHDDVLGHWNYVVDARGFD